MKKLNTNQLKYIALFFMFLDSVFFVFSGFLQWKAFIIQETVKNIWQDCG